MLVLERVGRFALLVVVVVVTGGLDAQDEGGVFDGHGAGGDEVAEFVDVEGGWLEGVRSGGWCRWMGIR